MFGIALTLDSGPQHIAHRICETRMQMIESLFLFLLLICLLKIAQIYRPIR